MRLDETPPAAVPRRAQRVAAIPAGPLVAAVAIIGVLVVLGPAVFQPGPRSAGQAAVASSSASPSQAIAPSEAVATVQPMTPSPPQSAEVADSASAPVSVETARAAVARYTDHLVRGEYAAAFAMLGEEARVHWGSAEAFASDRRAFFESVGGRYVVSVATGSIADWVPATYGAAIDLDRAVLIEVRYPALAANNAGYNLFIVNPTPTGVALYDVR